MPKTQKKTSINEVVSLTLILTHTQNSQNDTDIWDYSIIEHRYLCAYPTSANF